MNKTLSKRHRPLCQTASVIALALLAPLAQAGTVSYQGQFQNDDELFALNFSLAQTASWGARSWSFAGGTNAAGNGIAAGGFAPVLALFMQGVGLIQLSAGSSNSCGVGSAAADPLSGFCWDAEMQMTLGAGDYTLVLSQDGNTPLGNALADGYSQAGQSDYTGRWYLGQADLRFIQVDGTQRSGAWAFDMAQAATVPEPSPVALLLAALAALGWSRRGGVRQPQEALA